MPLLLQATDASMVGESSSLLEGKATQPIEQQAENKADNYIFGNNYAFARHAFVTRSSNETTRCSLPGGVDSWALDYDCK